MKRLQLFFKGGQKTELSPELLEQMGKIESLCKEARLLVERIRRLAQPNKGIRTADPHRLVPPDVSHNDRAQFAAHIRECVGGCFSDNDAVGAYLNHVADVQDEIDKYQDRFLRQVQCFSVNELKKFIDVTYVEIKQAYDEFIRRKKAYDYAQDRLKYCPANECDARSKNVTVHQKSFEEQAAVLDAFLARIPDYQMELAKAAGMYIKAEAEYNRLSHESLKRVKDPARSRYSKVKAQSDFSVSMAPDRSVKKK